MKKIEDMEKIEIVKYDFDVNDEVTTVYKGKEITVTVKIIGSDGYFNQGKLHQTHYVVAETKAGKEITIDPSQTKPI